MHLLFDLDGTLVDSFPGISRSINQTLAAIGREPVPVDQLRQFVGKRLPLIFSTLLGADDEALVDRAVEIYRPLFDEVGILESRVFPGIPAALTSFRESGHSLQVVTVRSIGSARLVVRHFGLDQFFDAVHGPDRAQRNGDKADLVRAALDLAGADPRDTIMIGDRSDDIRAARAHGVHAVAVRWGYGAHDELLEAAPDHVVETIDDLVAYAASAVLR
ncbi:MAG TPA: HAD hydrolase-like protein [Vicinamibacterales bacterium]|nr:HAD hydrolase-like protein [Vicinamibacterales bacterium]